jgi:ABC-type antimicrobial peptide transport system permease subunit
MILKNLIRRKARTILTALGIGIGVAAIIVLSSLADGLEAGYSAVASGSGADFVLTDKAAYDITVSKVDESIGAELLAMPEVSEVSAMLQGLVQTEGTPYFFVFSYPADSFVLKRFQVVDGVGLYSQEADAVRGKPLLLGAAAAESLDKSVGDIIRVGDSAFRVVGIYETGKALEEGAALLRMEDAQQMLEMQGKVSLFYIKVKDSSMSERLQARIERQYPDLKLSTTGELTAHNEEADSIRGMATGIAALALIIGGLGMMNAQLMSVLERTREIGVLRALGWGRGRVLAMILGESILIGLAGGLAGVALAWLLLVTLHNALAAFGVTTAVSLALLLQALLLVFSLGVVGGLYPAYRATLLQPVEALRYEGGSSGHASGRLPVGGMALQNLWRRKGRTLLTLGAIGFTVGAVMLIDGISRSANKLMSGFFGGAEVVVRQADISDFSYSQLDQRIGDRIAAMPEVAYVEGTQVGFATLPDIGWFFVLGYEPRGAAIQQFRVTEGRRIVSNHEIMVGASTAEAHHIDVGETLDLGGTRFKVVGIYQANAEFMEMGGVVSLRAAQAFTGNPRKVQFFNVTLVDPRNADAVVKAINAQFPEVHAALAGEFAGQLPDMATMRALAGGISVLAALLGGLGMMNTMLMTVLERTREIGVLRALGWRQGKILSLILKEALALGLLSAVVGVGVAFLLAWLLSGLPFYGEAFQPVWAAGVFVRAAGVALALGLIGGLFPALRASRMQPIEALRYE